MDNRPGHIEDNVIGTAGQPHQRIMLRARHNESFRAPDLVIKARDSRRSVIWKDIAPKLGPKSNDEVHSGCRGPWVPDGGDGSQKSLAFFRVQNAKPKIGMRGVSKSKDPSRGRIHYVPPEHLVR